MRQNLRLLIPFQLEHDSLAVDANLLFRCEHPFSLIKSGSGYNRYDGRSNSYSCKTSHSTKRQNNIRTSQPSTEFPSDNMSPVGEFKNSQIFKTEENNESTTFYHDPSVKFESSQIKGRWADEESSDDE